MDYGCTSIDPPSQLPLRIALLGSPSASFLTDLPDHHTLQGIAPNAPKSEEKFSFILENLIKPLCNYFIKNGIFIVNFFA